MSKSRLSSSYNTFLASTKVAPDNFGTFSGSSLGSPFLGRGTVSMFNTRAELVNSVISRIALDASMLELKHLTITPGDGSQKPVDSGLISCLTYDANIDQTGRQFIYDLVWSALDEGYAAIVPIETSKDIVDNDVTFDVKNVRVGKILQWFPSAVRVRCWNELKGAMEELTLPKRNVGIIESPLLSVLQNTNNTLELLRKKTQIMVSNDANTAAGKLNGFIQVPYQTKAAARKAQAKDRHAELEDEMRNSRYGLATLDANEKYIPVSGQVSDKLLDDITRLKQDFYNTAGITENILNGTANEQQLNLYYRRAVEPVLQAIVDELNRKFISKTARTQGQAFFYYRDPFKSLPVDQIANAADLFSRNAILTPNEIRGFIGKEPHPDPLANKLYNRNIADGNQAGGLETVGQDTATSDFDQEISEEEIPEQYIT